MNKYRTIIRKPISTLKTGKNYENINTVVLEISELDDEYFVTIATYDVLNTESVNVIHLNQREWLKILKILNEFKDSIEKKL